MPSLLALAGSVYCKVRAALRRRAARRVSRALAVLGAVVMVLSCAPAASAQPAQPYLILDGSAPARYVQSFNARDDESIPTDIPNKEALAWLNANVPRFD